MAVEVKIDVKGLEQLQASIRRVQQEIPEQSMAALREAGGIVAREAARRAPTLTGRMVRSIDVEQVSIRSLGTAEARVVVPARKFSRRYPDGYPYPLEVEYQRKPFIRPALAAKLQEIIDVFDRRVLREGAERNWGGK